MLFFKKLFGKKALKRPEDAYIAIVTNKQVRIEHPTRKSERIKWKDINKIILVNTDEGPFLPDIWLVLLGENGGCSVPHGSKAFVKIYDIVSKFENFNFENVMASMSTSENKTFNLWSRDRS